MRGTSLTPGAAWRRLAHAIVSGSAIASLLLVLPARAAPEPYAETIPLPADDAPSGAPPLADAAVALPPVQVSARHRDESAMDVAISMTVLDGDDLAAAGLSRAQDIQERVPGLVVSAPNARLMSYTIRGLGSSSQNDGIESSVGLFMDGVYLGRQGMLASDLIDLERIEILRGPQGTLHGKNTTAGSIHLITHAPEPRFAASLESSAGSDGQRQLRGTVNDALLGQQLSGRLTGYLTRRDGNLINEANGRDYNNQDKQGLRGQLLWEPAPDLSSRLIAEYGEAAEDCCAYALTSLRKSTRQRDAYMEYEREPLDPYRRRIRLDTETDSRVRQSAASNELNWQWTDELLLTSITAARQWSFSPRNDDSSTMRLVPRFGFDVDQEQLTQELRLHWQHDRFDLVGGAFWLRQQLESTERNVLGRDLIPWVLGGMLRETALPGATRSNSGALIELIAPGDNVEGTTIRTDARQRSESGAVFGQVDWRLTPRLGATLGLRYTHEHKQGTVQRRRASPGTGGSIDPDALTALPGALFQRLGIDDPRNLTLDLLLDSLIGGDYARDNRYSEDNVSGQVALDFRLHPDLMVYGSLARGLKGGGINLGAIGPSIGETFRPEVATSYELGAKGTALEQRLDWTLALYRTQVRDYQALTFDNDNALIANPRQINLLNVGRVRLQGIELEANARLSPRLSLRAGLAYGDAVTLDFRNAPDEDDRSATKDLSGQRLFNAPRLTATAGAEFRQPLDQAWTAFGGIDSSYRGNYFGTVEHGRGSRIDAYSLTHVRAGLRRGQALQLWAWVRNVFDEDYLLAINSTYGVGEYGAIVGDQRSYGASLRLEFR